MFWLAEDDSTVTQGAASRNVEGGLDLYVRLRGLQPGAHAKSDGCRVSRAVSPSRGVSGGRCKGQLGHARARKPARNKLTTNKWSSWKRKFARSTQFFSSLLERCPRCRFVGLVRRPAVAHNTASQPGIAIPNPMREF